MFNKILVIAPSWIGDLIMSQSLYQALKKNNSDTQIDLFAPAWSLSVVERMTEVDNAYMMPFDHGELKILERYKLGRSLIEKKYKQVIVLPGSLKSSLVPFFAKIPIRTGYIGESRYFLLNDIHKANKKESPLLAERYMKLAYNKNCQQLKLEDNRPKLQVDIVQVARLKNKFNIHQQKPIAIFCPGAEYGPAKRWPHYHYATLANRLLNDGWQIWLMGSNKDRDVCQQIYSEVKQDLQPDLTIFAGQTTLTESIDLMSLAKVCVTNDSGLMHIAAALDVSIVALYGPTDPSATPPLSSKAKILDLKFPREKVRKGKAEFGYHTSLISIKVDTVYDALQDII